MSTALFLDNPAYRESCRFIIEGHTLLGRGESTLPRSDGEQDHMERAWAELSEPEMERLWGLSADLEMLHEQEIFQPLDTAERSVDRLGKRLASAAKNDNWEEVLALLRYGPSFLSRDQIALLRGLAWQKLGHDDIALLFFEYAGRLKPGSDKAKLLEINALLKLGLDDEARKRSADYVARASAQPELLAPLANAG